MKKIYYLPFALFLMFGVSCSMRSAGVKESQHSQSQQDTEKELFTVIKIKDTIKIGDPVELSFTVYNRTDSVRKFLKWQTPFEALMSKYLDIKNESGEEAPYKGPMAKRMMPPPATAYITLQPADSLAAKVDLLKGYSLDKAGKYTITYTSEGVSGLKVRQQVSFVYK